MSYCLDKAHDAVPRKDLLTQLINTAIYISYKRNTSLVAITIGKKLLIKLNTCAIRISISLK